MPVGSVPMKLPVIVLPLLATVGPMRIAQVGQRLMTSPRTVEPPFGPSKARPVPPGPTVVPSSSIRRTASSPTASVFALEPGWL
jgi:hypothetical protein